MEKYNRAVRRHHRERLKKSRKYYHLAYLYQPPYFLGLDSYADPVGTLASWVNTPCPCSCYGCGNPRRHFKELTIQERRFECRSDHDPI